MKYRYIKKSRRPKYVVLRSKLKKERKKKIGRFLIFGILACAGVYAVAAGYKKAADYFCSSENFTIKQIEVKGNINVSKSEIISLLPFRIGDNLFKIWLKEAGAKIQKVKPELKTIAISRGWQKIIINIEEREPAGWISVNGEKFGIDNENIIFPLSARMNERPLPQVANKSPEERKEILNFMRIFSRDAKEMYKDVSRFDFESLNDISMQIKDGPRILWGPPDAGSIKEKLSKLRNVINDANGRFQGLEYINLAFFEQGRIIVKPKPPLKAGA